MKSPLKTENRPPRGRWRWQLLGLAMGALLAAGVAPGTSWLVRQQLRLSADPIFRIDHWQGKPAMQRNTRRDPNDVAVLVAQEIMTVRAAQAALHAPPEKLPD